MRPILIASGACVLAVAASLIFLTLDARDSSTHLNLNAPRLLSALKEFEQERRSRGEAIPARIPLQTLIEEGLYDPAEASIPDGVTIVLRGDRDESRRDSVLVEARLPDGSGLVVLGDGSVHPMSAYARAN